MGYAANRERGMCQLITEYVHGERETVEVGVNAEQEMKSKPSTGQSICQERIEELPVPILWERRYRQRKTFQG